MEDIFKPENEESEYNKEFEYEAYQLKISYYKTGQGTWSYSRGIVTKENTIICDIKRNYPNFPFIFMTKDNVDWFICGSRYWSQTFVNLNTGKVYENENATHDDFCAATFMPSPDKNTLAIYGCYWGASPETQFYDIIDIEKGWKLLPIKKDGNDEILEDLDYKDPHWDRDGIFTWYKTDLYSKEFNKSIRNLTDIELKETSDNDDEWEEIILLERKIRRIDDEMIVIEEIKNE